MESATRTSPPAAEARIGWSRSSGLVGYTTAVRIMRARAAAIAAGTAGELVWLLEHPPIYTAGTSASDTELIDPARFPVHRTGRGGRHTYHGPGQRIAYVMLDLRRRGSDVRAFVGGLEQWIIATLGELGVTGETRADRVGVWVRRPDKGAGIEDKIAAIGLRVSRWVSFHGISLNVAPDLEHYTGIVPCGIDAHGVTSLAELGATADMELVDNALRRQFEHRFGAVTGVAPPAEDVSAEAIAARLPREPEARKPGP